MSPSRNPIEDIDWRHRVATFISEDSRNSEGKVIYKKGAPVTLSTFAKYDDREIGFGDPSAPALFLNQSYKSLSEALDLHLFLSDWPPSDEEPTSRIFDYLELVTASIVFAYSALESFANEEVPAEFIFEREEELESGLVVVRQFAKDEIERSLSLSEKLASVLPKALDMPSPKGEKPWQGFVYLQRFRNRLIHLKSSDRVHSKAEEMYPDSIWNDLLNPDQLDYPSIAKSMILWFKDTADTHWLKYCPF